MTQNDARRIAERLLRHFGLVGWQIHFVDFSPMPDEQKIEAGITYTRPCRRLGLCRYALRVIELSLEHIEKDPDGDVYETVCHELAHALLPWYIPHGKRWQQMHDQVWNFLLETDDTVPRAPFW